MARIPPLRVRDVDPPEDVVPAAVWEQVVARVGGLILARPVTERSTLGELVIRVEADDQAIAVVRRVLDEIAGGVGEWRPLEADWWRTP